MRRATRGSDDDFQSARHRGGKILKQGVGRALRGNRLRLPWHVELLQLRGAMLHDFPIRFAAHENADQRVRFVCCHKISVRFYRRATARASFKILMRSGSNKTASGQLKPLTVAKSTTPTSD